MCTPIYYNISRPFTNHRKYGPKISFNAIRTVGTYYSCKSSTFRPFIYSMSSPSFVLHLPI